MGIVDLQGKYCGTSGLAFSVWGDSSPVYANFSCATNAPHYLSLGTPLGNAFPAPSTPLSQTRRAALAYLSLPLPTPDTDLCLREAHQKPPPFLDFFVLALNSKVGPTVSDSVYEMQGEIRCNREYIHVYMGIP